MKHAVLGAGGVGMNDYRMVFNGQTNRPSRGSLKSHRVRQNEERLGLGSLWEDHNLVFPNRLGKPMNADNLYHREFKPLLKKAGLSGFTFHSLRHTCASLLLSKNINDKIVQEMLGHATISTTIQKIQNNVSCGFVHC